MPTAREFIDRQDAQVVIESEAAPIFDRLRTFGETPTDVPTDVAPGEVQAQVLNGSGVGGQARVVFDGLAAAGFAVVDPPGNADRSDYTATEVRYAEGSENLARFALAHLGGAGKLVEVDSVPEGTNVVIVIGRDFETVSAPTTTVPGATPTTVAGPPANPGGEEPLPEAGC